MTEEAGAAEKATGDASAMPRFRYETVDGSGLKTTGELVAETPVDAFGRLEADGVDVVSLAEVPAPESAAIARLSAEDASDLARQIGLLASSGLPMHSGLRALREELPSRSLRRALGDLADRLERGMSLDEAMEIEGERFPEHIRGLIEAGTESGRLGEILGQYTDLDRAASDRERSLWASLAYPILLISFVGMVLILLLKVILNDYVSIFRDFGVDLPLITRILIDIGESIQNAGPWTILGPLVAIGSVNLLERLVMSPAERRRMANELPLFGPLWRWSSLAEFSHLLAILISAEVPLPKALAMAGRGVRDPALLEAAREMATEIEAGSTLAAASAKSLGFPAGFTRILRWAEPYQSLSDALHMAGSLYEARAKSQANFVSRLLTSLTIAFTLFLAVFAYLGLFLPMIRLMSKLTG